MGLHFYETLKGRSGNLRGKAENPSKFALAEAQETRGRDKVRLNLEADFSDQEIRHLSVHSTVAAEGQLVTIGTVGSLKGWRLFSMKENDPTHVLQF